MSRIALRQLSSGSLVAAAVSLLFCAPEALGQLRVRKNYRLLNVEERTKFRDALVAMKGDTSEPGGLWLCTVGNVGNICSNNADCGIPGGVCDMTQPALCEWTNKYDKYVCWHDKCG